MADIVQRNEVTGGKLITIIELKLMIYVLLLSFEL